MRVLGVALGALTLGLGLAGLLMLGVGPRHAMQLDATRLAMRVGLMSVPVEHITVPFSPDELAGLQQQAGIAPPAAGAPPAVGGAPSHVTLSRIGLDADVVPAPLVHVGGPAGAVSWEVPAYRVGHVQGSASLGAAGNMILLGHVSSLNAGNVFADLQRVLAGDEIAIRSSDDVGTTLRYRVSKVLRVTRDDLSVLASTDEPSATLITCTGTWLPKLNDFSHRLAVRAVLQP